MQTFHHSSAFTQVAVLP